MRIYPVVKYPTILEGFVSGDKLRLESLDGGEKILEFPYSCQSVGFNYKKYKGFYLKDFFPFELEGKMWAVTHLQKYSTYGYLKTNPDCYHRWYFFKKQDRDEQGNWKPGTEKGIYFRKPFSWRWDKEGTVIDGELRHWIWTKGYFGGHWD